MGVEHTHSSVVYVGGGGGTCMAVLCARFSLTLRFHEPSDTRTKFKLSRFRISSWPRWPLGHVGYHLRVGPAGNQARTLLEVETGRWRSISQCLI